MDSTLGDVLSPILLDLLDSREAELQAQSRRYLVVHYDFMWLCGFCGSSFLLANIIIHRTAVWGFVAAHISKLHPQQTKPTTNPTLQCQEMSEQRGVEATESSSTECAQEGSHNDEHIVVEDGKSDGREGENRPRKWSNRPTIRRICSSALSSKASNSSTTSNEQPRAPLRRSNSVPTVVHVTLAKAANAAQILKPAQLRRKSSSKRVTPPAAAPSDVVEADSQTRSRSASADLGCIQEEDEEEPSRPSPSSTDISLGLVPVQPTTPSAPASSSAASTRDSSDMPSSLSSPSTSSSPNSTRRRKPARSPSQTLSVKSGTGTTRRTRKPRFGDDGEPIRYARPACPENSLPHEIFETRFENPLRPKISKLLAPSPTGSVAGVDTPNGTMKRPSRSSEGGIKRTLSLRSVFSAMRPSPSPSSSPLKSACDDDGESSPRPSVSGSSTYTSSSESSRSNSSEGSEGSSLCRTSSRSS